MLAPLIKKAVSKRAAPALTQADVRSARGIAGPLGKAMETAMLALGAVGWWANQEIVPLLAEMKRVINDHVSPVSILAFGADPSGETDSTAAIQAAINAATNGVGTVDFPPGTYVVSNTLRIVAHGTHLKGHGTLQTFIQFQPIADTVDAFGRAPCFQFDGGTTVLSSCSISDMTFSSTDTTYQKVMVEMRDVSEFRAEHLRGTQWAGNSSMGLLVRGREFIYVQDCTISCPRVVTIGSNPNNSQDCSDQSSYINCYFTGTSPTDNLFTIDDGVTVGPTLLLNVHMNGGLNGLYWNDTSSTARSDTIRLIGCRYEQTQGYITGGWGIYLHKAGGQGGIIHIEDWSGGNSNDYNGIHITGLAPTLTNCEFQGTGGVHGLQLPDGPATLRACRMNLNNALVDFGGSDQVFAISEANGADPRHLWLDDSSRPAANKVIAIYGQNLTTAASGGTGDLICRSFNVAIVVTPGLIAVGAAYNNSYGATGVAHGDYVVAATTDSLISNGVILVALASNINTVSISVINHSAAPVDFGAGTITVNVKIIRD